MKCATCIRQSSEVHHIFPGTANRKLSEKYGLKVPLCRDCHNAAGGSQLENERYSPITWMSIKTIQQKLCAYLDVEYHRVNLAINTHEQAESRDYLEEIAKKLKEKNDER